MAEQGTSPPRRRGGWRTVAVWLLAALAAGALCWYLEGREAVEMALDDYLRQGAVLLPRLIAGLLISGFIQVLVPRHLVVEWLGDGAGFRGIIVAAVVGALTPAGPMLAFPLVLVLRNHGASITSLVTFITAWASLGLHRIMMWELPLLGTEFALIRYVASIPLPIIAGLTVLLLVSLWPGIGKDRS